MKEKVTEAGFAEAAQALNCDIPAIKAVCSVEAPRGGFLDDGRVTILFERHKFYKYTGGRLSPHLTHSDICNLKPGGYGSAGAHQWARFSRAFALDPHAAMLSCSWGKFQIMGFNFALVGFESVDAFVEAMKISEDEQLKAFVKFVLKNNLASKLRRHDWAGFALGYNGENYKINAYDVKLAAAYRKHSRSAGVETVGASVADMVEPVDVDTAEEAGPEAEAVSLSPDLPAPDPSPAPAAAAATVPDESVTTKVTTTTPEGTTTETKKIGMTQTSPTVKKITIGMITAAVLGALQQAWQSSQEAVLTGAQFALKHMPMILLIIAFAGLAIWLYNKDQDRKAARLNKVIDTNSDKSKHDVLIT